MTMPLPLSFSKTVGIRAFGHGELNVPWAVKKTDQTSRFMSMVRAHELPGNFQGRLSITTSIIQALGATL